MQIRQNFYLITILVLFSFSQSRACICANVFSYDNLSQLKGYEFIARAKVIDEIEYEKSPKGEMGSIGLLKLQVIELFQGEIQQEIFESAMFTSCDLGVTKGEEWLFFGKKYNGKIYVHLCERSTKYKEVDGLRNWQYDRNATILTSLQKIYHHPVKTFVNEIRREYYENGQLEMEGIYKDGKLDGEMKVWYSNGVLFGRQSFVNDTLQGKYEWFFPSGQISQEEYYNKGIHINLSKHYYDSTITKNPIMRADLLRAYKTVDSLNFVYKRIQEYHITGFDNDGNRVFFRNYSRIGQLKSETYCSIKQKTSTKISYHDNGVISIIGYMLEGKYSGSYQIFNEQGVLIKSWDYDKEGNSICPTNDCKRIHAFGEFD